ncbi:MAG TPA: sn-glycerol-1-phosphate dehydrogenase [Roseiflexaceae bacterium]
MDNERINTALRDATDTRSVIIGAGVIASVDHVFAQSFGDQPAVVVADENTFAVAGKAVYQRLQAAGRKLIEPFVFPGQPTLYADYRNVLKLGEALRAHDAIPVAVGSGTLNDITKLASYECGRQYMVAATAASMDGYTAFGAAITREGYKQTMTCPAPRAVLADLDILVHAPPKMTASGYADLLGKVTAGADWLIADALEVEPIDPHVWSLVQGPLREWTARPAELRAGDQQATEHLIEGLIMAGLAMQAAASSRPASGSEHQFSHLWEMEGLGHGDHGEPPLSHGFKVGVGSIAIAALYERVLMRDFSSLDIQAICRAWPTRAEVEQMVRAAHSTPGLLENAINESLIKYVDADQLTQRLALLGDRWPALGEWLAAQLMTADHLRGLLRAAGCPIGPADIGLGLPEFKATYHRAQQIRRRYTVLDLAVQTGLLTECVDELFAPGGFWSTAPHA